jgi:hypothetical protein
MMVRQDITLGPDNDAGPKARTVLRIAFFADGLSDTKFGRSRGPSAASRTVTMPPLWPDQETRSGRNVTTTKSAARLIVTAWANMSQSLRIELNGREKTAVRREAHYSLNGLVIKALRSREGLETDSSFTLCVNWPDERTAANKCLGIHNLC